MRVCIVDDNEMVTEALALVLRDRGHIVSVAANGAAGLAQIASDQPDVALIDLQLPDMSGRDVIARLRSSAPGLPIVATSGRAGAQGEADLFLEKPFTPSALLVALERAVLARRAP